MIPKALCTPPPSSFQYAFTLFPHYSFSLLPASAALLVHSASLLLLLLLSPA